MLDSKMKQNLQIRPVSEHYLNKFKVWWNWGSCSSDYEEYYLLVSVCLTYFPVSEDGSKMSVNFYYTTWSYIPEECIL
jgi:hypothetical protein